MGKVGSTSVTHALVKHGIVPLHIHWGLVKDGEFPTTKEAYIKQIIEGNSPPLRVITIVREPVSRNKSAFFQQLNYYCKDYINKSAEELHEIFVSDYKHDWGDRWFEKELHTVFDINLFEQPFDYDKGYKIYDAGKHKILVIRLEDCQEMLSEALKKLIGKSGVQMMKQNVLEERKQGNFVADLYKEFNNIPIPQDLQDTYRNLNYYKTFYGGEKWLL